MRPYRLHIISSFGLVLRRYRTAPQDFEAQLGEFFSPEQAAAAFPESVYAK